MPKNHGRVCVSLEADAASEASRFKRSCSKLQSQLQTWVVIVSGGAQIVCDRSEKTLTTQQTTSKKQARVSHKRLEGVLNQARPPSPDTWERHLGNAKGIKHGVFCSTCLHAPSKSKPP